MKKKLLAVLAAAALATLGATAPAFAAEVPVDTDSVEDIDPGPSDPIEPGDGDGIEDGTGDGTSDSDPGDGDGDGAEGEPPARPGPIPPEPPALPDPLTPPAVEIGDVEVSDEGCFLQIPVIVTGAGEFMLSVVDGTEVVATESFESTDESGLFVVVPWEPTESQNGDLVTFEVALAGDDGGASLASSEYEIDMPASCYAPPARTPDPVKKVYPTAQIGDITRDGCTVTIPVTTTGAGTFTLEVYDDGEVIDSYKWTTAEDGSHTVLWTISRPAQKDARGVGFYVSAGGGTLDFVDPYEYPDEVSQRCSSVKPTAAAQDAPKTLADTGANAAGVGILGVALVALGGAAIASRQRRQS